MSLTDSDLVDAAELCLATAATTDLDQVIGGGSFSRRVHQARCERFLEALKRSRDGVISILEFGISPDDCAWVAGQLKGMERRTCQLDRFLTAEKTLREYIK